jgi:hypothetical protein
VTVGAKHAAGDRSTNSAPPANGAPARFELGTRLGIRSSLSIQLAGIAFTGQVERKVWAVISDLRIIGRLIPKGFPSSASMFARQLPTCLDGTAKDTVIGLRSLIRALAHNVRPISKHRHIGTTQRTRSNRIPDFTDHLLRQCQPLDYSSIDVNCKDTARRGQSRTARCANATSSAERGRPSTMGYPHSSRTMDSGRSSAQ